jgi:hypothetical protein
MKATRARLLPDHPPMLYYAQCVNYYAICVYCKFCRSDCLLLEIEIRPRHEACLRGIRLPGNHHGGARTAQFGQIAICSHADREPWALAPNDRTIRVRL